jgi:hypothetical protein
VCPFYIIAEKVRFHVSALQGRVLVVMGSRVQEMAGDLTCWARPGCYRFWWIGETT